MISLADVVNRLILLVDVLDRLISLDDGGAPPARGGDRQLSGSLNNLLQSGAVSLRPCLLCNSNRKSDNIISNIYWR